MAMIAAGCDPAPVAGEPPEEIGAEPKREVKKLSIFLPASLHLRARRHSMLTDQTLTQLVTTLLSDYLDAQEGDQRPGGEG